MFRVRFHLAKGPHYMHWQIVDTVTKEITYCDPRSTLLRMHRCVLRNQAGTARKIHQGADKKVCAWIQAEDVEVIAWSYKIDWNGPRLVQRIRDVFASSCKRVRFNPRVAPHWTVGESTESADGARFERLDAADVAVFVRN